MLFFLYKVVFPATENDPNNLLKFLSRFGDEQLVMVNYACGFNQAETGKHFE